MKNKDLIANTEKIRKCQDEIERLNSKDYILIEMKKLDELFSERTVLLSGEDKWHEAYSAGSNSMVKIFINVLEKI